MGKFADKFERAIGGYPGRIYTDIYAKDVSLLDGNLRHLGTGRDLYYGVASFWRDGLYGLSSVHIHCHDVWHVNRKYERRSTGLIWQGAQLLKIEDACSILAMLEDSYRRPLPGTVFNDRTQLVMDKTQPFRHRHFAPVAQRLLKRDVMPGSLLLALESDPLGRALISPDPATRHALNLEGSDYAPEILRDGPKFS